MPEEVLRYGDIDPQELNQLLTRYQITICEVDEGQSIPGSFWGDDEAGLIKNHLYLRVDTPIHSVLHEASHYICMDDLRRQSLHTNAGSDDAEESAVCYLQVLLAQQLPSLGLDRNFADMDSWGYSFRLGSSRAWFEEDARESLNWLILNDIIDEEANLLFRYR